MTLTPTQVAELVNEYRAHRPNGTSCGCGQPAECPTKRDLWHQLFTAGSASALYTTRRP